MPMKNTFRISHLIKSFEILQDQGIHLPDMIKGAGITSENAMDPFHQINLDQQDIVLNNICRLNDDPYLGFKVGMKKNPAFFGAPMQAILSSANLRECNQRAHRLEPIYAPYLQISTQPQEYRNNSYISEKKYASNLNNIKGVITETSLTVAKLAADAITGNKSSIKLIRLGYKKPANHSVYDKFFRCPVEFDCEKTEIWLSPEVANKPSLLSNSAFAEYTEKLALSQAKDNKNYNQPDTEYDFSDKVSNVITAYPKLYPNVDQVAERLCISPRTMHRKLEKTGTSFQKILDNIKLSFAERYILHTRLTIDEIAIETGFSSGNSFRVAFKSWTNLTPSAFRNKHQSELGKNPKNSTLTQTDRHNI